MRLQAPVGYPFDVIERRRFESCQGHQFHEREAKEITMNEEAKAQSFLGGKNG